MNINVNTTVSSLHDRVHLFNRYNLPPRKDTVVLIFIPFICIIDTQWDVSCKIKVSMFDI